MPVIKMDDYRPHVLREVSCLACNYEWDVIYSKYSEKDILFKCPDCGSKRQAMKYDMCVGTLSRLFKRFD